MIYRETYRDLCHGTDVESAKKIKENGFELHGDERSWCGIGVYFYDIKNKAWWAAKRHCESVRKVTGNKVKPTVVLVDIVDIEKNRIFDLRIHKDLCDFEECIEAVFGDGKFVIPEAGDEERIIELRSMLIDYYAGKYNKKLIIGNFKQRSQPLYEHTIEFANSLDVVFGIETIYCVKDTDIVTEIKGGECREG